MYINILLYIFWDIKLYILYRFTLLLVFNLKKSIPKRARVRLDLPDHIYILNEETDLQVYYTLNERMKT